MCVQEIITMSVLIFDSDSEPPFHWPFLDDELASVYFSGIFFCMSLNKKITGSYRLLDRTFVY